MVRKKGFVDNKKAQKYYVSFGETYSCETGQKLQDKLQQEEEDEHLLQPGTLSLEDRQEIIELGLPDDGYNYLQHLQQLGTQAVQIEKIVEGKNQTYVQAEPEQIAYEDIKLIDASRLKHIVQAVAEEEAQQKANKVTLSSKEIQQVQKDKADYQEFLQYFKKYEIEEQQKLQKLIEEQKQRSNQEHALEQEYADEKSDMLIEECDSQGDGDLQDDFIIQATQADEHNKLDVSDTESIYSHNSKLQSEYISQYQKPEILNRNRNLTMIDERYENMIQEYDSDEIGSLDGQEEAQGDREMEDLRTLLFSKSFVNNNSNNSNMNYYNIRFKNLIQNEMESDSENDTFSQDNRLEEISKKNKDDNLALHCERQDSRNKYEPQDDCVVEVVFRFLIQQTQFQLRFEYSNKQNIDHQVTVDKYEEGSAQSMDSDHFEYVPVDQSILQLQQDDITSLASFSTSVNKPSMISEPKGHKAKSVGRQDQNPNVKSWIDGDKKDKIKLSEKSGAAIEVLRQMNERQLKHKASSQNADAMLSAWGFTVPQQHSSATYSQSEKIPLGGLKDDARKETNILPRSRNESKEDKANRKKLVKEQKREARQTKKNTKENYKNEELTLQQINAGGTHGHSIQKLS